MKKLQYTTNNPSATTDYLAADNTWKTIPGGGGGSSGIPHGTTSGTDTYTTTISGVTSLSDGDAFLIRFATGNTTSCTLNINSLGAKDLYRNNDGALIGGDIIDGAEMLCIYNSSTNRFQVIGTAPNTLLAYVTNAESTSITKGQPVYAFGGQGDRLKVKLAYNTSDATSAQTVGIVLSTSIAANQKGLIIINGQLDGLSLFPTSTWADGDAVYLGATAGSVTKTKPVAPNHLVYLGFVTTANNGSAGRMYVRVQNGYEMDELHNVSAVSPNNNDILKYNTATSLWETSNALSTKQDTITGAATTITSSNLTASRALISDASGKVATNAVTSTELGYLSGVTSAIQTQISGKQNTITGAASTVVSSNLSNGIVVVSDGGGKIASSGIYSYELGYLSGATSNIQTQLNSKIGSAKSFMGILQGSTLAGGATQYGSFNYNPLNATELARIFVVPYACTASNFYIRIFTSQPANGSFVFTLRKNQADTAVVATIAAGSAANTEANSGASTATYAAGDDMSFSAKNNATTTSGNIHNTSIMIEI